MFETFSIREAVIMNPECITHSLAPEEPLHGKFG
jgi:hypothetical protein